MSAETGITSSAGLDDDDLWIVEQCWTVLWAQMSVNVVQWEDIILGTVDPENSFQFSMRHDHHHHAVCVLEFGVF